MNRKEILAVITESVAKIVEHHKFELTETTTANDVDGWESVTHMMIISEIESAFNIKFKLMDLMNMNNTGDLINSITNELQSGN